MSDDNQHNILYFESTTMRGLFDELENWQNANHKRFLSTAIHRDGDSYCCIALTNPMEVVIKDSTGNFAAKVLSSGHLLILGQVHAG